MRRFRILAIAVLIVICSPVAVAASVTPQEKYISKYAAAAVQEMYRSGVPASITLAQGILESRSGESYLTVKGNNHFGIKCHRDWTGGKIYWDDDAAGECFRAYKSAAESFSDHSDFLRYRDRYKALFDLKTTDYKGWAYGLKKAGYATDPSYATKLIKIIEDYRLYEFDTKTARQAAAMSAEYFAPDSEFSEGGVGESFGGKDEIELPLSDREMRKLNRKRRSSSQVSKKSSTKVSSQKASPKSSSKVVVYENLTVPESPRELEEPVLMAPAQIKEVFRFSLSRETYVENGVPFVYAQTGETYASIAASYNLFLREILSYNDLKASKDLLEGEVVFIQPKKKQAKKGLDKYIVEDNDISLRDICQRFGVKMKSVIKMNSFPADYRPVSGDTILLR